MTEATPASTLSRLLMGAQVSQAIHVAAAPGIADRCTVVAGSFFEEVPAGGDAYMMKSILLDWDDPRAAAILRVCRSAMLEPAGFDLVGTTPTASGLAVIDAQPS
jgi:hypothetical protein